MIEELLEALLKGGQGASQPQARVRRPSDEQSAANNPWMDILEGLLKGGMGGPEPQTERRPAGGQEPGGTPLDLGKLLEIFLGGGQRSTVSAHPVLAPFVEALSEKLGLSPQLAATIVSYAFSLIVATLKGNAQSGAAPQDAQGAPNLDHLLDGDFLDASGLSAQLANNTGLAPADARESLRTALEMLSKGYNPDAQPVQQPSTGSSKLQHLLDEW